MKILIISFITLIILFSFIPSAFSKDTPVGCELFDTEEQEIRRDIKSVRQAIREDPSDYLNYSYLAFLYDYLGEYENELKALELGAKYVPQDYEDKDIVYGNLARAYLLTGRIDEAKPWIDKAVELNPYNPHNLWRAVIYHIFKNEFQAAAKELKRLQDVGDSSRDYYYEAYQFIFEEIEDDEEVAVKLFEEAVKIDPQSPLSHRALGVAIRNSSRKDYEKNMPKAIEEFNKALELNPKYIPTYICIANTFSLRAHYTGDDKFFKDAFDWFDKAFKIDPDDYRLTYAVGNMYLYKGDYDEAIEKFELVYKIGPEDEFLQEQLALAYNSKAYAIYQSGENLEQGLELIEKAIQLAPDDGIILSTKAELLYKLEKYEEAHKYIKQAIALDPGHEEMSQDLANIEEALAQKKEAPAEKQEAKAENP